MTMRLAVLVGNDLTGDSRVHKICTSAIALGYEVTAVALPVMGSQPLASPYPILRVGRAESVRKRRLRIPTPTKLGIAVALVLHKTTGYDLRWATAHALRLRVNRQTTLMVDRLREIAPDIIHANDVDTLPAAVKYAASQDRAVAVVYDSHEYVRGVHRPSGGWNDAMLGYESRFIGEADRIVTVSTEIAELLRDDYRLSGAPSVVVNFPNAPRPQGTDVTIRSSLGLSSSVTLGVYTGVAAEARGLNVIPDVLYSLRQVHICLVTRANAYVEGLQRLASRMGVAERLHVVPYVAPELVASFISDADFGLSPLRHHLNHELACPTKIYEFVQARLPIVTSDVAASAAFVTGNHLGAVFTADDATSCAAAITQAMADRPQILARLNPDFVARHTWEGQQHVLDEVYRAALQDAHDRANN